MDKAVARMANKAGSRAVIWYWSTQRMRKMWVALGKTARKMVPEGAARAYWWMAGICLWCAMTFWGETTSSSNAQFAPGNRCWRGFSLNFFCSGLGSGVSLVLAIQYSSEHKCQIMRQIRKTCLCCLCYPFLMYTMHLGTSGYEMTGQQLQHQGSEEDQPGLWVNIT